MNSVLDSITIGEAREIARLFNTSPNTSQAALSASGPKPGDKVIVRSRDAGVQYGTLVGYEGSTVHLTDARQMWSWEAKEGGTLLDCAQKGVSKGQFSSTVDAVTVIGACAIISTTGVAQKTLEARKWES